MANFDVCPQSGRGGSSSYRPPGRVGNELPTRGKAAVPKICTAAGLRLKIYWVVFSKRRNAVDVFHVRSEWQYRKLGY